MLTSALLVSVVLAGEAPAQWHLVECKPGAFRVRFPGKPKEHKGGLESGSKAWYANYSYSLWQGQRADRRGGRVLYLVGSYVPTAEFPKGGIFSIEAFPREERDKELFKAKKRKGKVLLDKLSNSLAVRGYALIVEYPDRQKRMLRAGWYVTGGKAYQIKVAGPSEKVRGATVDRFFESFKMGR